LKDGTRVRILEVLKHKTSLSYGELLSESGVTNTGRLNYHLKILDDLISKDEEGRYDLSEKGSLAIDFLQKLNSASQGSARSQQSLEIPKTPFSKDAKALQLILGLEVVMILAINLYAYFTLPSVIPLHYEFNGQMLTSGPKYIFLILGGLFIIPQIIFLQLSFTRYSLVNYSLRARNFPFFDVHLPKINYERRGYWVNKYFVPIIAFGALIGVLMIALNLGIYESTLSSTSLSTTYIVVTLVVVAVAVVGLLIYMRGYLRGLATDTG